MSAPASAAVPATQATLPGATQATTATPAPAVAATPAASATPAATPAGPVDANAPPASPNLVEFKGQKGTLHQPGSSARC